MLPRYPTTTDEGLRCFSRNLSNQIADSPEDYGLTSEFAEQYRTAQQAFDEALFTARNPNTNTTMSTREKNAAMKELRRLTTQCVRTIQKHPGTTDLMRVVLGLPDGTKRRTKVKGMQHV